MEDKIYELAKKKVKEKKGFYLHFSVYLAVGAFFFIMNALTYYDSYEWWFFFPLMPWGVALTIHYFSVFGLPGGALSHDWEERELRKELQRLRSKVNRLEGPDNDDHLELRSLKKDRISRAGQWNEDELV